MTSHSRADGGAPHDERTATEEAEALGVRVHRTEADDGRTPRAGPDDGDVDAGAGATEAPPDAVSAELTALADAVEAMDDAMEVLRERVGMIEREIDDVWMELHGHR